MTEKNNKTGFDPEKDKDIKKGPLKPEHKNQYGNTSDDKDRTMSERVKGEKDAKNHN